jgi:hypothetical protein
MASIINKYLLSNLTKNVKPTTNKKTKKNKSLNVSVKSKTYKLHKTSASMNNGMREKIIRFDKSSNPNKKYTVIVEDINTGKKRTIHFGASAYEQYKDRTPLKLYSKNNHNDKRRQMNYYSRHSHGISNRKKAIKYEINKSNGYYNAKILSHIYLWG